MFPVGFTVCVSSTAILKVVFVHAVPLLLTSVKHVGATWKLVAWFQMGTESLAHGLMRLHRLNASLKKLG